jgi:hypothetical protein
MVLFSKYTINNLVSYLDYIFPLICSQCEVYTMYYDFSSVYGFSDSYVSYVIT